MSYLQDLESAAAPPHLQLLQPLPYPPPEESRHTQNLKLKDLEKDKRRSRFHSYFPALQHLFPPTVFYSCYLHFLSVQILCLSHLPHHPFPLNLQNLAVPGPWLHFYGEYGHVHARVSLRPLLNSLEIQWRVVHHSAAWPVSLATGMEQQVWSLVL